MTPKCACGCGEPPEPSTGKRGRPPIYAAPECRERVRSATNGRHVAAYRDRHPDRYQAATASNTARRRTRKGRSEQHAFVEAHKTSLGCCICGLDGPACLLDLHHVDPSEKVDSLAKLVQRPNAMTAIRAEIAKCVVLCANHHRLVTYGLLTLPQ